MIDLDRLVIKHSTELDNRPFGTRTIGVSLGSITEQFDWICRDQIDYQDIDRQVRLRRNERENLSIQTKYERKTICAERSKGSNNSALVSLFSLPPPTG